VAEGVPGADQAWSSSLRDSTCGESGSRQAGPASGTVAASLRPSASHEGLSERRSGKFPATAGAVAIGTCVLSRSPVVSDRLDTDTAIASGFFLGT